MNRYLLLICLFYGSLIQVHAQDYKRTQNWYFGDKAGLSFATNPPSPLTDGAMNTVEGCATMSDTAGNLLFYTNGVTVWNKNHQIMQNGTGLSGHESSTQAALIVPQPGNDSLFYVFTTYALGSGPHGFRYSIVNLNRNNGLGAITKKNVLLQNPVCEKLTATKHANGKDIWVLAHGFGNDLFYAYLVTEHGIVDCPVVSKIGSVHSNWNVTNAQGDMKFSSSGKKIGVCQYDLNRIELFHFNQSSGLLYNLYLAEGVILPYSVSFSQNENFIYVTSRLNYFYQYDISSGITSVIKNTKYSVLPPPNTTYSYYRYLKLASNNMIYTAMVDSNFIGVITYPDSAGSACGFEEKGIDISPKVSKYGLPNFVSSYFYRPAADFGYELDCETNTALFAAKDTIGASTYQWNISKSSVQSFTGNLISYPFPDTGLYSVELVAINGTDTARQKKQIFIQPTYSLELGTDTILCSGETLFLDAGSGQHCYLWSDSSAGSALTVDTGGLYHVKVVSEGMCTYFDSIRVGFIPQPSTTVQVTQFTDTLFASPGFDRYTWLKDNVEVQDSGIHYFVLTGKGSYKVRGSDSLNCFPVQSDAFQVDTLTGIQLITKNDFSVYPNPANAGSAFIIESANQEIYAVELYSVEGKLLWKDSAPSVIKHYTCPLKGGIYILSINQLFNYKIIVT